MDLSYKQAKEAFVSGYSGTTLLEVSTLILTACAGYHVRNLTLLTVPFVREAKNTWMLFAWAFELLIVILPSILVFTVLADYALVVLSVLLLLPAALILQAVLTRPLNQPQAKFAQVWQYPYPSRIPFLSALRTFVTLCSVVAILAVDFAAFPRRLAKVETYGVGLMDVGVGLFVHAHGVTSPEARGGGRGGGGELQRKFSLAAYLRLVGKTTRGMLPLMVLGVLRLLAVKSSGYQEHVSEYGIHWNFFFTIAAVRLFSSLLQPLVVLLPSRCPYGLAAALLLLGYQCFLSWGGGEQYLLLGPLGDGSRPTVFSANREGIISSMGYLSLYLFSVEIGRWLFGQRSTLKSLATVLIQLSIADVVLWTATCLASSLVQPVSRRFANGPFVLWMLSLSTLMSAVFALKDLIVFLLAFFLGTPPSTISPLYHDQTRGEGKESGGERGEERPRSWGSLCVVSAINHNQMVVFLLANVLTGAVNFSMNTLQAGPLTCLTVLCVYMALLCVAAVFLYQHNLKIKL